MDDFEKKYELFDWVFENERHLNAVGEALRTTGSEELVCQLERLQRDVGFERFNDSFEETPRVGLSGNTSLAVVRDYTGPVALPDHFTTPDLEDSYQSLTLQSFGVLWTVRQQLEHDGSALADSPVWDALDEIAGLFSPPASPLPPPVPGMP